MWSVSAALPPAESWLVCSHLSLWRHVNMNVTTSSFDFCIVCGCTMNEGVSLTHTVRTQTLTLLSSRILCSQYDIPTPYYIIIHVCVRQSQQDNKRHACICMGIRAMPLYTPQFTCLVGSLHSLVFNTASGSLSPQSSHSHKLH